MTHDIFSVKSQIVDYALWLCHTTTTSQFVVSGGHVEIDVVLCNHAEVAENKLFLVGGGVNTCFVAPEPPHVITLGLGCVIHVPYHATNQAHTLKIVLLDEDGQPVTPYQPEGMPEAPPFELTAPFNIGRPPMIGVGDEQTIALAANFDNLPLSKMGLYGFVVTIDGTEMRHCHFRVMAPPPGLMGVMPAA